MCDETAITSVFFHPAISDVFLYQACIVHSDFITLHFVLYVCAQIEKRLETVRSVLHNTHKKLVSCLQGQLGTDTDKRHVRSTWFLFITVCFPPSFIHQLHFVDSQQSCPVINLSCYQSMLQSYLLQSHDLYVKHFLCLRATERGASLACSPYRNEMRWISVTPLSVSVRTFCLVLWTHCISSYVIQRYEEIWLRRKIFTGLLLALL